IAFLQTAKDSTVRRRALEGLLLALQDRHVDPPANWKKVLPLLREDRDKEVQRLAGRLAVYFNDAQAVQRSLAVARNADRPARDRIEAIHDLALVHPRDARQPLQEIVIRDRNLEVRLEACRALSGYDEREMPRQLLAGWKNY